MKIRRIFALLLLVILLLTGCANVANSWDSMWTISSKISNTIDDGQIHELTESMINAIRSEDYDTAYSLVAPIHNGQDLIPIFQELHTLLKDLDVYTLMASNINKTSSLGSDVSQTTLRYMLSGGKEELGEVKLYVDVGHSSEYPQALTNFHISVHEEVTQTGSVTTMKGASVGQWIMLIIGLLEIGFILWMFVDCCTHKVKKKWLWLLLIALGALIISVNTNNGFRLNFNVGLFLNAYTVAIAYSNGAYLLRVMIPVGAIIYLTQRKALFAKAVAEPPTQPAFAEPAEPQLPTEESPETEE